MVIQNCQCEQKLWNTRYHDFHRMVCSPYDALECIRSFQSSSYNTAGSILFMPSHYQNDELSLYDATRILNRFTYYVLVLLSATGLSSVLGLTTTLDQRDFFGESIAVSSGKSIDTYCVWPKEKRSLQPQEICQLLSHKDMPTVQIRDSIFEYMEQHIRRGKIKKDEVPDEKTRRETTEKESPTFFLKRRFEYRFNLVGLHVMMLHFSSVHENETTLHLVEVYHFRNAILQLTLGNAMWFFGHTCKFFSSLFVDVHTGRTKSQALKSQ